MSALVYLSAAPEVRALCLPDLIAGFDAEVVDGSTRVEIVALGHPLEGRATGRAYHGLPWWEVREPGEHCLVCGSWVHPAETFDGQVCTVDARHDWNGEAP